MTAHRCPGCGQTTVRPELVVELAPRPVPADGRVLFVLALPDAVQPTPGEIETMSAAAHALAEEAAPGRADLIILGPGVTLDMLTDEQLAAAGLQRNPGRARD